MELTKDGSVELCPSGIGTSMEEQLLQKKQPVLSHIHGTSMLPLLKESRSLVVLEPVRKVDGRPSLKVGDILLFRRKDEALVLHRLVEIRQDAIGYPLYITRGDNCLVSETSREASVLAKVREVRCRKVWMPVSHPLLKTYGYIWMAIWPMRKIWKLIRFRLYRIRKQIFDGARMKGSICRKWRNKP